ncbi:hypothetical protein JEQ12_000399 [Ovis aries]|uniref:Uncharacterized protein n=1 Tax=Ovis aries TaxID=9940 RepID=A0A836D6X8_SHEEP|nr:hypothetical protein JEQ12_000399 [Ovis aries]
MDTLPLKRRCKVPKGNRRSLYIYKVQALALRMLHTPADFTAVKSAQVTREQKDPFFCWSNFLKISVTNFIIFRQILKCLLPQINEGSYNFKERISIHVVPLACPHFRIL